MGNTGQQRVWLTQSPICEGICSLAPSNSWVKGSTLPYESEGLKDRPQCLCIVQVQESPPPTLDDLFKKTSTKPCLYWLPLTEAEAANKKAEQEAAALENAKIEELPAPPVPMEVS